jgi:hypothetical protein
MSLIQTHHIVSGQPVSTTKPLPSSLPRLAFDLVHSFDMTWFDWCEEIEIFANIIETLEDWFGSDHIWSVAFASIGKGFKSSPWFDLLQMFLSLSLLSYVFSLSLLLSQAGYTWTQNKLTSRKQTDPSTRNSADTKADLMRSSNIRETKISEAPTI